MLHLSGDVVLDFGAEEVRTFQGAERLWHVDIRRWTRRKGALALRGHDGEASPNSLMTGSWEESDARREGERTREQWRDFRIAGIVVESAVVKSFRLERSEEQTSELQSLMRNSYAVFCLKKK